MAKPDAKLSIKIGLFAAALALGWYLWNTISRSDPILESNPKETIKTSADTNHPEMMPFEKNIFTASSSCLGVFLKLDSLEAFADFLKDQGDHQHNWHWDNYFLETPLGETKIIHVVSDQNSNNVEIKALKVFREDSDGPTLLEEGTFHDDAAFKKALAKKLTMGKLDQKQTTDSFSFDTGLEIKRTTENEVITELSLRTSSGVLDCQFSDNIPYCKCH
jgi:hypothetical protein